MLELLTDCGLSAAVSSVPIGIFKLGVNLTVIDNFQSCMVITSCLHLSKQNCKQIIYTVELGQNL